MKKIISLFAIILCLILAFTACSSSQQEEAAEDQSQQATEEQTADGDGQNPAMNFVGNYGAGRANIFIECDGMDGMKATVTWGSSAWEHSEWVMSGSFDSDKLIFEYDNCTKTDIKYAGESEDGEEPEIESSEEIYTGGKGRMIFTDDPLTILWMDDEEHMADDLTFEYVEPVEE